MTLEWQIPRNALLWLLLMLMAVTSLFIVSLPLWIILISAASIVLRWSVFQGRIAFPSPAIKVLFICFSVLGIYYSYRNLVSLEAMVTLLLCGFSLKLLESRAKRDCYLLVFVALLTAATALLFQQNIGWLLLVAAVFVVSLAALAAMHQSEIEHFDFAGLRSAMIVILQALPLMALLFLIFPRFSPLWSVPLAQHQGVTGISDELSPGSISSLAQDDALAFRVKFAGDVPPQNQLYWRGLILPAFDGEKWTRSEINIADANWSLGEEALQYTIIQEPTYQPWLFVLPVAASGEQTIRSTRDYRLEYDQPISQRIRYSVHSELGKVRDVTLDGDQYQRNTALPASGNVQARRLAGQLYGQSENTREYVLRVLNYFSTQPFYYTLNPPLLDKDRVDAFLFSTRKGFCGHYASAFTYLMRAAGVPARVVVGYQGGEFNPLNDTLLVYQFDAHAWAEVWMAGQGWVRVDPTAAVAPSRVERGLESAVDDEDSFLSAEIFSLRRHSDIAWVNQLRLRLNALDYAWSSWLLAYKGEQQQEFLQRLLGDVSALRLLMFMAGVAGLSLAVVLLQLFWRRQKNHQPLVVKYYLELCRVLERAGFPRQPGESAMNYAQRLANEPAINQSALNDASKAFEILSYQKTDKRQQKSLLEILRRSGTVVLRR